MRIGSYQLRERVGEGGFARVYHATGPDGDVAIKVLAAVDGTLEPAMVARFEREIETLAKVRHPSLVSLLDHGVDPARGPYLVMPLLVGLTLRDLIPKGGLGPEAALRLLTPVVQAMGALHAAGLVHRDLKPENVIVSPRGEVTLVDLGLALGIEQSRLTQAGAVAGSVPYMAPEQIDGADPRPESDVWSLGVLLYELVTGRRPFARGRAGEEVAAILAGRFDGLAERDRRVSRELDALVSDVLQRDADERPADAHELLHRVEALMDWAPPAAQRSEVMQVLTDLSAYQKARAADRVAELQDAAHRASASGDTFAALALLDRALAYRPDDRGVLSAIENVSAAPVIPKDRPTSDPPVDAHARTELVSTRLERPSARPAAQKSSRGRWVAAGVGGVLALVAVGVAGYLMVGDEPEPVAEAEPVVAEAEGPEAEEAPDEPEPLPASAVELPPLTSLDDLTRIPAADLEGGPMIDMGTNIRQPGEPLVPASMLGSRGPAGALQHIEDQLAARPGDAELRVGRALALLGNGREREGLSELEALSRSNPELAVLWGGRGYVAMRLGQFEEAERFFTKAVELDPTDHASLRNRGILRHRRGKRAEAYADLLGALRYGPHDVNTLSELAQIYERTGHRMWARPLLERVVRARPTHAEAWVDLSMVQPDTDEALASLDRALQLNPSMRRAYTRRCTVLARSERPEAVDACTRAMEAAPNDPWMQMQRGLAHYHAGDDETALVDIDAALERRPRDPVMLVNRYFVLEHAGRTAEARADLRLACDLGHEPACNELAGRD